MAGPAIVLRDPGRCAADRRWRDVLGMAADKADWPQFGAALTVVVGGSVALFVGPSAAWLAAGISLFVGVAVYAAASAKRLSRT